ncbi:MAG TPA: two-component regulator propeller domain-containing protein [Bacteroidia bacterium]|nr:two-component regulator propeller domain-containing protein [Bacteroidia bacterium]
MKHLLSFFLSLALSSLAAQETGQFRHYTTEDGLSQNSVYSIVQDRQGFMWMATQDGLSRFDGYRFEVFHPDAADSNSLSNNSVRCLLVARDGLIWIGTRDGLNVFDPVKKRFSHFFKAKNGLISGNILSLAQDSSGNIWVSSLHEGVSVYNQQKKTFSYFRHDDSNPNSLCGNDVRGMCCDHNGHMWLVTWSNGMSEYDPSSGKWTTFSSGGGPGQLSHPNSRGAICADSKGRIWIGTWGRGLDMWDPSKHEMFSEDRNTPELPQMRSGLVWSVYETRNGHIWFTTAEKGVYDFDPATGHYRNFIHDADDPRSINDNSIWSITEDRSGLIWTGAWQGGVNVYDPRMERFALFRVNPNDSNSLPANVTWTFCTDGAGGIWMGTAAGPVHYDPVTKQFRQPPLDDPDHKVLYKNAPTPRSNIQALCRDGNGNIWMGTAGAGLHCYDPVTKTYDLYMPEENNDASLTGNTVNSLTTDEEGNVWVCCGSSPFQRFDPVRKAFENFPFAKGDSIRPNDGPVCSISGGPGKMIVGLTGGEVFELDVKTRKYTLIWKSPSDVSVTSLCRDKLGSLWIGMGGSGLMFINGKTQTLFTDKDGLPNDFINGIIPGDNGELWLSTNRGICRFDPVKHDVRIFTTEDGLQANEFNQGGAFRSHDGRIWFGGVNGISAFFPDQITPNTSPAAAIITSLTVLNKKIPLDSDITFTKEIRLSWRDYFFSFEFSGLEFTNPERNQYKYMMEGFDDDWVDAGTRRFATYTNLDPGEYTFRVKASNNDGNWDGREARIHIIITPPFWKTKWFYTLCGIFMLLSVVGYIRWRERKLRKEKEVLESKVTERTYELQQEKEKVTAAHKDIRDSINYAQRIQYALLSHDELLKKNLPEHFIFFRPKDVVSGDFYWATQQGPVFWLAVCDSTGHGVPGAFMSLLNISYLNEAIIEKKMTEPGAVFDYVRSRLIENISQDGGKDGMDAILLKIDHEKNTITYAAAHNAPVVIVNGNTLVTETDKMPVGKGERTDHFKTRTLETVPGEMIYLFTDGCADQFGGPAGKKFKEVNLRKNLAEISALPAGEQRSRLEKTFEDWKSHHEQVDDVLVIGVRI